MHKNILYFFFSFFPFFIILKIYMMSKTKTEILFENTIVKETYINLLHLKYSDVLFSISRFQ